MVFTQVSLRQKSRDLCMCFMFPKQIVLPPEDSGYCPAHLLGPHPGQSHLHRQIHRRKGLFVAGLSHLHHCRQRHQASNEEILTVLKDVPNPNQDDDDEGESFNPLRVEVFLQTLLHLPAKSFSHSFSALGKFHKILKNLAESDEGKLHILKVVYEVWKNHPQTTAVLVDKMIRTQMVDCAAVANWLFSQDMAHEFTRLYIWEILHSTIRKMNKHVQKIPKELEEAEDKLEKQQHKRVGHLFPPRRTHACGVVRRKPLIVSCGAPQGSIPGPK
ncbi:nuclear cap-binding protein subunit 1-like [Nerophis ophidion]|uniref:nuclear cap-binding protein subunit 1-like n=1 Tax=Nerophis ophidion TaxID=159077 RepID=UPI002ADF9739|nr:nuclear cap-binding protein subunit 1-like [Nerophis ophidion]